jgi:hypothetical protein
LNVGADHDRGVEVDHQPGQLAAGRPSRRERLVGELTALRPRDLTCRSPSPREMTENSVVELVEQPSARRVRCHRPEQLGLIGQHRDVGDRRGPSAIATAISISTRRIVASLRNPASASASRPVSVVRSATSASSRDPACDTHPHRQRLP